MKSYIGIRAGKVTYLKYFKEQEKNIVTCKTIMWQQCTRAYCAIQALV